MDRSERLAIAVEAQAACIRADEARKRHAVALRHGAMLEDALFGFEARHGHPRDPKSRADHELYLQDLETTGAARLTRDEVKAARDAAVECHELDGAAVRAMDALSAAWGPEGGGSQVLRDWVGCTPDEYRAAVAAALPDLPFRLWDEDAARN
jgi:hypothetical protein